MQDITTKYPQFKLHILALLLAVISLVEITQAQVSSGSVIGVVTDALGARVPGASVTLIHGETKQAREAVSDQTGNFSFVSVPGGMYSVTIKQRGFQVFSGNVAVAANSEARADAKLRIGRIMESVSITTADGKRQHEWEALEVGATRKLVKDAPYSAEIITEFTQTLPDGNRIGRRDATNAYRDSQGRTRKEHATASGLSNALLGEMSTRFKVISDPVEGVNYLLDEKMRVAQRQSVRPVNQTPKAEAATSDAAHARENAEPKVLRISGGVLQGGPIKRVQPYYPIDAKLTGIVGDVAVQVTIGTTGEIIAAESISGPEQLREAATIAARQWLFKPTELSGTPVNVTGVLTFKFAFAETNNSDANVKITALGQQMIEGVECEGSRKLLTIPAGTVGNEQPLEIISETWYAPILQIIILSKQRDPRFGEKTVRVANLLRIEPDETLFKIPSNYTINNAQQ